VFVYDNAVHIPEIRRPIKIVNIGVWNKRDGIDLQGSIDQVSYTGHFPTLYPVSPEGKPREPCRAAAD
jgi:hypothetical protein